MTRLQVTLKGSQKIILQARVNGTWVEAPLKLKKSIKPDSNSQFNIPAQSSGQNFNIIGLQTVSTAQTPVKTREETCVASYDEGPVSCRFEYIPETCSSNTACGENALGESICKDYGSTCSGGYNGQVCEQSRIPIYGTRQVTGYSKVKTTQV